MANKTHGLFRSDIFVFFLLFHVWQHILATLYLNYLLDQDMYGLRNELRTCRTWSSALCEVGTRWWQNNFEYLDDHEPTILVTHKLLLDLFTSGTPISIIGKIEERLCFDREGITSPYAWKEFGYTIQEPPGSSCVSRLDIVWSTDRLSIYKW